MTDTTDRLIAPGDAAQTPDTGARGPPADVRPQRGDDGASRGPAPRCDHTSRRSSRRRWLTVSPTSDTRSFCAATPREIEGLVAAGLGDDVLLANETLDAARLGRLADDAQITVAVDSDATLDAAIHGGVRSVLIDVEVGLPRCGCDVDDAARLADRARAAGLDVRGVMGYEGHLMMVMDRADRASRVEAAMEILLAAHAVGRRRRSSPAAGPARSTSTAGAPSCRRARTC